MDVKFQRKTKRPIPLSELKAAGGLDGFLLTRRGNRLSVFPVDKEHWDRILELEKGSA